MLAVLLIVLMGWGFWSLMTSAAGSRQNLNDLESQTISIDTSREAARIASAIIRNRQNDIQRVNNFFVDKNKPINFVEDLESSAKRLGNDFIIDLDEGRSKGGLVYFRLTVSGTEKSTRQYLKLLELMPYKISIEEMEYQDLGKGGVRPPHSILSNIDNLFTLTLLINVKSP